jgi:hypothetical protein
MVIGSRHATVDVPFSGLLYLRVPPSLASDKELLLALDEGIWRLDQKLEGIL